MNNQKIVSFDPASTKNLGWSKFEIDNDIFTCDAGTFVIPTQFEVWESYWPMHQVIDEFLSKEHPDLVIIEKTSAFRASSSPFVTGQVSHCMGIIFALCGKYNLKVEFAFPTSVKLRIAGHGKASKSQIKRAVKQYIYNITNNHVSYSTDHAYDAAANILYYMIGNEMVSPISEFPWLTPKQKNIKRKKKKVEVVYG